MRDIEGNLARKARPVEQPPGAQPEKVPRRPALTLIEGGVKTPEKPRLALPKPESVSPELAAKRGAQVESVRKTIDGLARTLGIQIPNPGYPRIDNLHFAHNLQAAQIRGEHEIANRIEHFGKELANDKDMEKLIGNYRKAKATENKLPRKLVRQLGVLFGGSATEDRNAIGNQIVALLNEKRNQQPRLKGLPSVHTLDEAEEIMGIKLRLP